MAIIKKAALSLGLSLALGAWLGNGVAQAAGEARRTDQVIILDQRGSTVFVGENGWPVSGSSGAAGTMPASEYVDEETNSYLYSGGNKIDRKDPSHRAENTQMDPVNPGYGGGVGGGGTGGGAPIH